MAPSFDFVASSFLCPEDDNSVIDYNGDVVVEEAERDTIGQNHRNGVLGDFLVGEPLPEDSLELLVKRECEYLLAEDYLKRLQKGMYNFSARRDAITWIEKVHAHFNFGTLSAYLSIHYMDRFLSSHDVPPDKPWLMELLAVSCLSLAAKMEENEVPLSLDLQVGDSKFIFEPKSVQRMELLVLSTLKWRMQAVTPFSYMEYFLQKIYDDKRPPRWSIFGAMRLILSTIKGIEFLGFRPSEIAAAVAIIVTGEVLVVDLSKAFSPNFHVEKEKVLKCCELIQRMELNNSGPFEIGSGSVSSVPQSPSWVLDGGACLSYVRDELVNGSCANSHANAVQALKKRKLNSPSEMGLRS